MLLTLKLNVSHDVCLSFSTTKLIWFRLIRKKEKLSPFVNLSFDEVIGLILLFRAFTKSYRLYFEIEICELNPKKWG